MNDSSEDEKYNNEEGGYDDRDVVSSEQEYYKPPTEFSYHHTQQLGGSNEQWDMFGGTEAVQLGQYKMKVSSDQQFMDDISRVYNMGDWNFTNNDTQIMLEAKPNWKSFKIPELYVAGYYLYKNGLSNDHLDIAQNILTDIENPRYQFIKYARYWQKILLKSIRI